jgi:sugar phosphate isomerase/epimerase
MAIRSVAHRGSWTPWAASLVLGALAVATHGAEPKLKIGYCTGDTGPAKAAGFDYVEARVREFTALSDADFAKFVAHHKEVGLPTPVAHWFLPADLKVAGTAVDMERVMTYLQRAFARCETLGIKLIVFGSGDSRRVPDSFSKDEAFAQLVSLAKRIAPEARKHKIVILVEPLRKQETNMINTTADGLKWVEAVADPNFELMVDLYHLSEEGEDPAIIVKAAKHIKHAHMSNPHERVFPLRAEEYDYSGFLSALRQIGYDKLMSIEAKTDNLAVEGPKAIAFIHAAYAAATPRPAPKK